MDYYFIGIKGSGMSALACLLKDLGNEVSGSDIPKYIFYEAELKRRGIEVLVFNKDNIHDNMNIIIGNDFDERNEEVAAALANPTCHCIRYFEFLGQFCDTTRTVSIAGTHGKTTTTGMAYHVFKDAYNTSTLIGDGTGWGVQDASYFIMEACEYKEHFMYYHPQVAILTNIDHDHVDYYPTIESYCQAFENFANQTKDTVLIWGDDPYLPKLNIHTHTVTFGMNSGNDIQIKNLLENSKGMSFDVYAYGELYGHFNLPIFGHHILMDTLSVIALAINEGLDASYVQDRLACFGGVKHRYAVTEHDDCIYVDDYAHHPTAIKYVIEATRVRYPDREIVALFKPDRFSRIKKFATEFATELGKADYIYLCHFPENAHKEAGIDIDISEISQYVPNAKVILEDYDSARELAKFHHVVYLFMSDKDIYKLKDKVIEVKEGKA